MNSMSAAVVFALVVSFGLSGCGKIPTWNELTSGPPEVKTEPAPAPVQAAPVPVKPPEPTADEVIAKFKILKPQEIADSHLLALYNLKERANEITEINAMGSSIGNTGLNGVARLPNLRQLNLSNTNVDAGVLGFISESPSIETLNLSSTKIEGSGIGLLQKMPNLKFLELNSCKLSEAAWEELGNFPNLEGLWIAKTPVTNQAMEAICRSKSIQHLSVNSTGITDVGLVPLQHLETLVGLDLGECKITGEGLSFLGTGKGLKNLKTLSLANNNTLTPAGANLILKIHSLELLNMTNVVGVNDVYLKQIFSSFPQLNHLAINGAGTPGTITDKGMTGAAACKKLRFLRADGIRGVSDLTLKALSRCKDLQELHIAGDCTITGAQAFKKARPDCKLVCQGVTY